MLGFNMSRPLLALTTLLLATLVSVASAQSKQTFNFDVLLDKKPIGTHAFTITNNGTNQTIETIARFDVKKNGCVVSVESSTDSNGDDFSVSLSKQGNDHTVINQDGKKSVNTECLYTFAYWDKNFVDQQRLLNTQNGDMVDIQVRSTEPKRIKVGNRQIEATGFHITEPSKDIDIKVYYDSSNDQWVALESVVNKKRTLRYVLREQSN